ncbi:nuclear transport factor 2 family protein [Nonomuraea sp. 3N208]|uniref:nuclear transport factor 2 family protein n=1 Tax=Nonomuraea sp. 3N208 TaxID=3457421 RepID=UPI003FD10A31
MSEPRDLKALYRRYVAAFNAHDFDELETYLSPELVFDWGSVMPAMRGRAAMFAFYREAWTYFDEEISASDIEFDGNRLSATITTEIRVFRDWPECPIGPMQAGPPYTVSGRVEYLFEYGRIAYIDAP